MSVLTSPPTRLLRWIFRIPLLAYRLRLGWLFGHRFARLTHRGRRSGLVRRAVVEVVRYDRRTHEVVVAAGWGGRTDWYRNIQATPALEILTGTVAYRPSYRFLTADELYREIQGYARRHPLAGRFVLPRLVGVRPDAPEAEIRAAVEATLRGVLFYPRAAARPGDGSERR
jgi:deazaflavin-dependent oxidoreductase (nitroreductase family)